MVYVFPEFAAPYVKIVALYPSNTPGEIRINLV